MKKNNFKGLVWLIIVLIILVIFLIALVIYKGFFADNHPSNIHSESSTNNTTTITHKQETLSDEEIEKYLSYVPFSLSFEDAYEGKNVDLNNVNKATLLSSVLNNEKLTKEANITVEGCIDEKSFNNKLLEMYNLNIMDFESGYETFDNGEVSKNIQYESYLTLENGCYWSYGRGGRHVKSIARNISYDVLDMVLIIEEQVGILGGHDINVIVYDGNDEIISLYGVDDNGNIIDSEQQAENYVKENLEDFNTYKHTFKKHDDGTGYYWYSTEVVES